MTAEIIKLERASDPAKPWIARARYRKHVTEIPAEKIHKATRDAMGRDDKGYFNAAWSPTLGWLIGTRAKEQRW